MSKAKSFAIPSAIPPASPPFGKGDEAKLKLKPEVAPPGDVPRAIDQHLRARPGYSRFKVRAIPDNLSVDPRVLHYQCPTFLYVEAETEEQAKKLYADTVTTPPGFTVIAKLLPD